MPQIRNKNGQFRSPFKHCGTKNPPKRGCDCGRCSLRREYCRQHLRDRRSLFPHIVKKQNKQRQQDYYRNQDANCMYQQLAGYIEKDKKGIPWEQYLGPVMELAD